MPTKSDIDEITAAAAEFGATIVSVFTEEEVRNLRTAVRWGELYNSDATQMVKECYATDCRVEVKGAFTYHGHDTFIGLEQAIHSAARGIVKTCGSGCFRRPPFRLADRRLRAGLVG